MKRVVFVVALLVMVNTVMPVIAQVIPDEKKSEYYYFNIPIERIYPYRRGYVVSYQKIDRSIANIYLPIEWFTDAAGRGELITIGSGQEWPHAMVYYRAGEFSHIRLFVRRERGHESWGNVPLSVNIDERFDNVEDIKIEF
jgi:hypothetical protein